MSVGGVGYISAIAFVLASGVSHAHCYTCPKSQTRCETSLVIENRLTMMHEKKALYPSAGKLYYYDVTNTSASAPVNMDDVITADGWENMRLVVVANGTLPGPDIILYEGQTVNIHVRNHLLSDTITIHWHGLRQKGTPHMDGVGFITQCPILPFQTFTYTFKAEPKGTFWYHAHVGTQSVKGLHGAFVVRPMQETNVEEHIMSVQDWNHDWDGEMDHTKSAFGIYDNRVEFQSSMSLDGAFFSNFRMQSGLINGRGRYYDPQSGSHNEAPLSVFEIEAGKQYRFRVIGSGALYPFRVSVDKHKMELIASDGYDLEPEIVESFIINPGERFDVIIRANQLIGNYWIRAKTLEINIDHHVEAILRYVGAPEDEPSTSSQNCSAERCLVVNCPFSFYPKNSDTDCITFDQLKAKANDDPAPQKVNGKFQQFFMNFGFTPGVNSWPSGINGRSFVSPGISSLSQPKEMSNLCSDADCGEQKTCKCTHSISLNDGNTVEIILSNMGKAAGWSHPVHMHGHSFYVLKMGYGTYNKTTGKIIHDNMDIDCRGGVERKGSYCNDPTWSNRAWLDGDIPGLEYGRPPRKDTLIIPTGGYAVIRIVADNPGVWFMHCHIKLHNIDGMALMLNESFKQHPPAPKGFPICHDFPRKFEMPVHDNQYSSSTFWTVVGLLIAVGVIEFLVILYKYFRPSTLQINRTPDASGRVQKQYAWCSKMFNS